MASQPVLSQAKRVQAMQPADCADFGQLVATG
jgi:hypothetical protein